MLNLPCLPHLYTVNSQSTYLAYLTCTQSTHSQLTLLSSPVQSTVITSNVNDSSTIHFFFIKWPINYAKCRMTAKIFAEITSVSETIRKPPFIKAKTALKTKQKIKYGEKRFSIWRMEFLHPAMWHNHDIDFARWLHPAMWHVALKAIKWIQQVAAPCNVTRSSGIMTLNSPGGNTLQCGSWMWDDMPCYM